MKLKITSLLTALILLISVNAQEKETSFKIKAGGKTEEAIYLTIPVYEKGFMIVTAKKNSIYSWTKEFPWDVRHYDLDLNLKMHTPIETKNTIHPSQIFKAPVGEKIIFIKDIGKAKSMIQQISLDNTSTEHQISKEKWKLASPGNLKAVFVTDSAICYISSKYGNEAHPKKKIEEKLILYKVRLNNYKSKKINLKLPKINTETKKTSFWSYEAHNNNAIYFASINNKKLDNGFAISVNVIKKDYKNNTLKEAKISFERNNVAKLNSVNQYSTNKINKDAYLTETDISAANGIVLPRSKCAIKIDTKNDYIYLYGLEQLKTNVKENHMRAIFVKKYDFDGELIWESDIDGLSANSGTIFSVNFNIEKNQSIKISTSGNSWGLSAEGKLLVTEKDEDSAWNIYWKENKKSREKTFRFINNISDNLDALIEHNQETGDVKVMLFKK